MISCKNLSYRYETFEKQEGIRGTLSDLKKRKYKLAIKLDILLDRLKQIDW